MLYTRFILSFCLGSRFFSLIEITGQNEKIFFGSCLSSSCTNVTTQNEKNKIHDQIVLRLLKMLRLNEIEHVCPGV